MEEERKPFVGECSDEESSSGDGREMRRLHSFSKLMREGQTMFIALESLFRKVVQEEVERIMLERCLQFQANETTNPSTPTLKLAFKRPPSTPVFTGGRIFDDHGNPLQLLLLNTSAALYPDEEAALPYRSAAAIKVELVALDGDFASGEEDWSCGEFESRIVRQRAGKRPLLVGDVVVIIKDGAAVVPELRFTDNSSWTKSGRFKIGARVYPAGSYRGPRIKEAISEGFKVRDHRGESYQKHHPPALGDAVWRLVKIGKGGVFHRRMAAAQINTVQDFLIKFYLNPIALRQILGGGMSDRTWESTTGHAQTCDVGGGIYVHRGLDCDILLNSVCQVVRVIAGTNTYTPQHLDRVYVQKLAREAYENWGNLEQYDADDVISPDLWVPRAAACSR